MAAPSGTKWGSIVGDYGKLGLYITKTTTDTKISGTIEIWFASKYSIDDKSNTLYYDNLSTSGEASTSRGPLHVETTVATGSGWSGSNQVKLASYTYSYYRGTSASTRYLYAKLVNIDRVGGTMYVNATIAIPALTSYTVSFNANGGSGAPSAQTKYYGKSLTLSSTKPTKSGYTFVGWGTSATDTSADYSSDGTYTTNAEITLYAIWKKTITLSYNTNGGGTAPSSQNATVYNATTSYKFTIPSATPSRTGYTFLGWSTSSAATTASYSYGDTITISANTTLYAVWQLITFTIRYDANGGANAPGNQTKKYGTALTLTSDIPTRDKYNFIGWATSSGGSVVYESGDSYITNANATLYAVWEVAYVKPRISNFVAARCDANGVLSDTGTYASISFTSEFDTNQSFDSILIELETGSKVTHTKTITCADFGADTIITQYLTTTQMIGDDDVSTESTYTVRLTVTDTGGYTTVVSTIPGAKITMDFLAGGNGIAFNKPAEFEGVCDIGFQTRLLGGIRYVLLEPETDLNECHTPGFYMGENVSTYNYKSGEDPFPLTSGTFTLEILSMGNNGQLMQRITQCHITSPIVFERMYYKSAGWGQWFGGWIYPTINHDKFVMYGTSTEDNAVRYRKDGRLVEIRGVVAPAVDIVGNTTNHNIFTLEEGYRPNSPIYIVCQGSGNCTWLLQISKSGAVNFSRYRNGDTGATASAKSDTADGAWLPFQATYLV